MKEATPYHILAINTFYVVRVRRAFAVLRVRVSEGEDIKIFFTSDEREPFWASVAAFEREFIFELYIGSSRHPR